MLPTAFNLIVAVIFFIFSCCIGSFLNVLIDRIPLEESVIKGRSHCDSCSHTLSWYDLFPVFSFLFLCGKCRYCHKKIGWQTIGIEIFTGFLFVGTFYFLFMHSSTLLVFIPTLLYTVFIFSCFIVIAGIDIKKGIIPNKIVYPALAIALLYHVFFFSTFATYLFSALAAAGFFFLLFAITKGRGMGFGDVKLAILLGMFLGFPNILIALYIAFLTGALIAFILVLGKKKKFSGGTIPFGPFLILGALSAFFFGSVLWNNILHVFF